MTYSIVARDPTTGELGVAVQSRSFNTGAACAWAEAGVGAVATQSFTERRYGPRGLALLAPAGAIRARRSTSCSRPTRAARSGRSLRRLRGATAAHTGTSCYPTPATWPRRT